MTTLRYQLVPSAISTDGQLSGSTASRQSQVNGRLSLPGPQDSVPPLAATGTGPARYGVPDTSVPRRLADPNVSDPSFPLSVYDGQAVVTTPEEIDIGNAGLLREALASAIASGQPLIVVDMSGTEFCDSTCLNVLIRGLGQAQQTGIELRLVMGGAGLLRVLTVTGVAGMFRIYETLGQALEAA